MADIKLNLQPEDLDLEYEMLLNELQSLDDLFDSAKKRLDDASKIPSRANPVFMASQTSNLISIKEKRLNIIKELTNIKKSKMEMELKMFNANNKLDDQNTGISKEILDIYRLLNKNDKSILLQETIKESNENEKEQNNLTDKEIDDILNSRLSINEEKEKQKLPSDYKIVCTKDKDLYIIDEDYNIIEDCDFDLKSINIVKFDMIGNNEFAYDEDNNEYEVVEI